MTPAPKIIIFNDKLYIQQSMIIEILEYSKEYLRVARYRDTSWQYIKKFDKYFYLYDSIPYNERIGNKQQLKNSATSIENTVTTKFKERFKVDCEYAITTDPSYYMYERERKFNPELANEFCQAIGIINITREWLEAKKEAEYELSKLDAWKAYTEIASELCPRVFRFNHSYSFMNKVRDLPTEPNELREAIVSGRYGNKNKQILGCEKNKIVDTETGEIKNYDLHQAIIAYHWMNPFRANKLSKYAVYQIYLRKCEVFNLKPISLSLCKEYILKNRHWMSLERDGKDYFNTHIMPYIPQEKLKYSRSLYCADFSGTKLLYNDNGKANTMYMLRIIDVASEKIVGYALVDSGEPGWAIMKAMKQTIDNHGGISAYELVTDNGGAWNSLKPLLQVLFTKFRQIQLGNKQANPAEIYVKLLSEFSRKFENWSMIGFASHFKNIENRANEDYQKLSEMPTKSQMYLQIDNLVKEWNSTKRSHGLTPNEFFEKNQNPKVAKIDNIKYRYVFGNHSELAFADTRGILKVSKDYESRMFDSKDWTAVMEKIAASTSDKQMTVKVVWDKQQADIYSLTGDYILSLTPTNLSHKSIAESSTESEAAFEAHQSKKGSFKNEVNLKAKDLIESFEVIEVPYLTTAKLNGNAKENMQKLAEIKTEYPKTDDSSDDDFDPVQFARNQY